MSASALRLCRPALLAVLLAAAAALAWSAAAQAAVVSRAATQDAAEVRAYWTEERMEAAELMALPGPAMPQASAAAVQGSRGSAVEIAATSGVSHFDLESGSETSFPHSVHGKIFFTIPGEGDAACSGTLVASRRQNVVFTAGHCVHYPGSAPSSNLVFVPGYRDGAQPFGEYPAISVLAPGEWSSRFDISYDVAIVQLATPLERTLGARGVAFNKAPNTSYRIFGYPGHPSPPYNGERLIQCDASFFALESVASHPFSTIAFPCGMRQGSSGGGWVNPEGQVVSVVSHGYTDPSLDGLIVGPYFGDAVQRLYNAAGGSAQCPPARQAVKKAQKRLRKLRRAARGSARQTKKRLRRAGKRLAKAKSKRDSVC
jgi:Trypsin-like peptidase domain